MGEKIEAIDDYLAGLPADQKAALEHIRARVKEVAPKAVECISYGLPAFRLDGKVLVGFGASKAHCAFYPMSGSTVDAHQSHLAGFKTSKGTIRFTPDKPLPDALLDLLIRARIVENAG